MKQDDKYVLKLNYPASWWGGNWREALPSGNGKIGAAVYGGVHKETILLNHEDLWWQSKTPDLPDVSSELSEVQRLLLNEEPRTADRLLANALKEKGYAPQIACPLPLGDLEVQMATSQGFKNYSRYLNMETGEVTVEWEDADTRYIRELFVSRSDDLVVYRIKQQGPERIHAQISLDLHDRTDRRTTAGKPDSPLPDNLETYSEGNFIFYAASSDDGTDFGAVARVHIRDGVLKHSDKIQVEDATEVTVYLEPFIKENRSDAWKRLASKLANVTDSYDQLLNRHMKEHSSLFLAMKLDLDAEDRERSNEELLLQAYKGEAPKALVEKMWAFGRYLLISSSRDGGHPCPLLGLWCGEYKGFWAFNMVNENLQMIYWQALSGKMPELMLAVFDYCERMLDDFRLNAQRLYGCRGIYIPAPTVPDSGMLKHIAPHIIHWTGGAAWVAQLYYDYYLYTEDLDFLRKRALPFLRETALFYEDFFIMDENGYYLSCPSNSPENTPGNYRKQGKPGLATAINATMDFALAKEVLTHLIDGSETLNVYSEEVDQWKEMLARIPPYEINEDGAVKEWMHPFFTDNYHHRHQSHIYPLFPGIEVTKDSDPELFDAFVQAVKKRLGIGLNEQTGWSFAHMANIYARMGEGDLALECLDLLSRSCLINNFYTLHNDWRRMGIGMDLHWAPFQIDANMGWTAAVQEMLLFSVPGKIHLLPALPEKWKTGEVGPMLARGGVEVSIHWDRYVGAIEVEMLSRGKERTVDLVLPDEAVSENGVEVMDKTVRNLKLLKDQPLVLTFQTKSTIKH